jgi:predicted TIM-barrel fold metal-dependent hydrolase
MARVTYSLLRKTENVYFDISTMDDAGLLDELVNKFGSDRFLFSSGLPQFEPSGPLGLIKYARIPDSDKEKIFGGNWLKLEADTKWII